jgi:biopolymer transport protein TolQ
MNGNLWDFVSDTLGRSSGIEGAVVVLLLLLSALSWTVIARKAYDFERARRNGRKFLALLAGAENFGTLLAAEFTLGPSPQLAVFKAALGALEQNQARSALLEPPSGPRRIAVKPARRRGEFVMLAMQEAAQDEFQRLKQGLGVLSVIGSTAVFIGLFGTVWGIMTTFRSLGRAETATLSVVAPGIASALIATAAGLFVAIPAVVAYNWFLLRSNRLQDEVESVQDRLMAAILASGWLEASAQAPEGGA